MAGGDITLSDIDVCLKRLRYRLTFEPALETFYEEQTKHRRARVIQHISLTSLFVYNLLVVVDYVLLRDTFWWAVVLHFGIVTTASVGAAVVMQLRPQLLVRETLGVMQPLLMFAQIMIIYVMNQGEAADNYQYLATLVVVLMNAIQRPDYRFAVGTSLLMSAAYLVVIWLVGHSPLSTQLVGTVLMTTAVFNTLTARRLMERDARFAFLRRTQDKLQRDAVEALACRDGLTGLFNRRHLDEQLTRLWSSSETAAMSAAVLMIDVDHFKAFNDRYGHLAGDLCLARVASAITAQLSQKDDVAVRFGGEEFLVLLVGIDIIDAVRVAERIRRAIEALGIPHESSPCRGVVTASIGVMAGPVPEHKAADLIAAADTALYAAKRAGRNRVWPPFNRASKATVASVSAGIRQAS